MADVGLHRSVAQLLDEGEKVHHVVYMSALHRWALPYILGAALAMYVLAVAVGFEQTPQRISLAIVGATIGALSTTDYRALALTGTGLVLFRCSRIRRRATAILERLDDSTSVGPVGSNLLLTEYVVGTRRYFVSRRYQQDMNAISLR